MARPIEATPVLRGQDAVRFIQAASNPQPHEAPKLDLEKMRRVAEEKLVKHVQKQQ